MYSILGRGSFALITASIRHDMEVISLWHWWGGLEARFLDSGLQLLCIFWSLILIFLLAIPIERWGSGLVSLLASQHTNPWSFNQHLVLLAVWAGAKSCWKMKSASLKSWSAEGRTKFLQNVLVNGCSDVGFQKHNGPTPADDIAPKIITDCGNLTLDFKQLGLWASPPFHQTLGP